jgi:putative MATE family efflux protein
VNAAARPEAGRPAAGPDSGEARPAAAKPSPEILRLQNGPILSTLLKLAVPSVLAMVMQVLVGIAETVYVGRLGTTPLAAMALVFPFLMLAQQLSAGAMGGGVSSAVARALGASNLERANTLALHALAIGGLLGTVFTLVMLTLGPTFYRLLGGQGAVLEEAIGYSGVLFFGALFVWLSNTLASVLRGTGNMRVPSLGILGASVLQIVLGGVLALGAGPVPSLGMPGVAIAYIVANGASVAFFAWYLASGNSRLTLRLRGLRLQREMFFDILKVGAVSMLSPLQSVLTVLIFTGFVARLGVEPLAGYSIGQRLEFLLIPISFGIGVASVPMVGMAMGAGNVARARKVAWTAGVVSAFNLGVIGLTVAVFPDLWAALFTSDAGVLGYAREYLRIAGPAFAFFGLGLTLYFASQGSGKMIGPVLAGTVRLAVVFGAGTWLVSLPGTSAHLFGLVAASMVVYGLATVAAVRLTRWGKG